MRIVAEFISIFQKIVAYDKKLGIHNNGVDNNYPDFVEYVISESVTTRTCSNLMTSYLVGQGFGNNLNDLIINEHLNTTLLQFSQRLSKSIADHTGVFIHVNYDENYEPVDPSILPFGNCRVGKKDAKKYNSKIIVCENWGDKKATAQKEIIDVWNPNKKIVKAQIKKAGGFEKYKGQVLYYKETQYIYPLSRLHPCIKDAEAETASSIFKYTSLKKGFFGKTLVVTKPMVDHDLKLTRDNEERAKYEDQISERKKFRETMGSFMGVDNLDGVLHLEAEFESDNIDKEILFKNIDSNIDDKIFAHTEASVKDNIRTCYNNVPPSLIMSQDGKLFGSSGEAIREMKLFYQDQTKWERLTVQSIIRKIFKSDDRIPDDIAIIPLIEEVDSKKSKNKSKDKNTDSSPEALRLQSQATLKGSVGGVTALLEIQKSVSSGTTSKEAAIVIIEEIFGINKEIASDMLGDPTPKPEEKS